MSSLKVTNLSAGYRSLVVFSGLNLDIPPNSIVGIIGPNGVGKSTLLKTLAGLLSVHTGSIHFQGKDVTDLPAFIRARNGLVLVPEGRQIFQALTVRENLGIPRSASRFTPAEYDRRRGEILTIFPRLGERIGQRGGSLSGGEQQMLAISRALLVDPAVLMLDEPTQGLAPIMIAQVLKSLVALRGRFAMLVVEQNREFLNRLCDVTFEFRGGRLEKST